MIHQMDGVILLFAKHSRSGNRTADTIPFTVDTLVRFFRRFCQLAHATILWSDVLFFCQCRGRGLHYDPSTPLFRSGIEIIEVGSVLD